MRDMRRRVGTVRQARPQAGAKGGRVSLVNFDVEIKVETALRSDNVMVFIGATADPPPNCTSVCPDHYLLTMAITPRPPGAWATLANGTGCPPPPMGDLMLIPPGYAQRGGFEPQSGLRRDIFCLFPRRRFEDFMGGRIEWTRETLCATSDIRDTNIFAATRRLAQEAMAPGMAASVLSDSLAVAVAVDVRRYFCNTRNLDSVARYRLSAKQLTLIRDYIHAHAHQELRLNQVADICGLSVRHLTRAFKSTTGHTLTDRVSDIRMKIAKELLIKTRLPQKVIAANIGFSSASSFSSAFRKLCGVTPNEYRSTESVISQPTEPTHR
jgi:AraC family transcriptional regulator